VRLPLFHAIPLTCLLALTLAFAVSLSGSARADSFSRHEKRCRTGSGESSVRSCDWLIRKGSATKSTRHLPYLYRAYRLEDLGRCREAIADFTKVISYKSDYGHAYYRRALCYDKLGEIDKKMSDLNQAIRVEPGNAWYYVTRGWTFLHRKQFEKARADGERALQLDPDHKSAPTLVSRARSELREAELNDAFKTKKNEGGGSGTTDPDYNSIDSYADDGGSSRGGGTATSHATTSEEESSFSGTAICITGVASDDVLNIRSGPGTGNGIVGAIPPDACSARVDRSDCDGRWCRVAYDGVTGWINVRYTRPSGASGGGSDGLTEHCVTGVASNDTLNMRTGPSSRRPKVGEIGYRDCGVMVDLSRCRGSWCYARYRGTGGWLHTRYVRER